MLCEFREESKDGAWREYRCITCNRPLRSKQSDPSRIRRRCEVVQHNRPPGYGQKLKNFSVASFQHVYAGCPTCTDEEITARHTICKACQLYDPDKENPEIGICTHAKCGCKIIGVRRFASKISWRDQKCPLDKWPELPPS